MHLLDAIAQLLGWVHHAERRHAENFFWALIVMSKGLATKLKEIVQTK